MCLSSARLRHNSATLSSLRARGHVLSLLAAVALLSGWAAGPAAAVTYLTDGAEASLNAAVASAQSTDGKIVVQFDGVTSITTEKAISFNLSIDATGHNYTIDAGGLCRIFKITAGTTLLTGLRLMNGKAPADSTGTAMGGSIYSVGTVNLVHCELLNNSTVSTVGVAYGGAIYSEGGLNLTNCSLHDNAAAGADGAAYGGAIYGNPTAAGCHFDHNTATGASSTTGRGSDAAGGASYGTGTVSFTSCRFEDNSAKAGSGTTQGGNAQSGAVFSGAATMLGCSFIGNSIMGGTAPNSLYNGTASGGAIYSYYGLTTLINCTFDGNQSIGAADGAAAFLEWCNVMNCTFTGNGNGGNVSPAISCNYFETLQNVVFARNPGGNMGKKLNITDSGGNISDDNSITFTAANSKNVSDAKLGKLSPDTGGLRYAPLLPGSPAIGYGNTSGAPATDMLGAPRTGSVDSGALQYNPALIKQPAARFDLHGSGSSDILWSNSVSGAVAVWQMNAGSYVSGALLPAVSDTNWAPVGIGDFNGDTSNDILWQNRATGDVGFWPMNGMSRLAPLYVPVTKVADTNWQIVAVADFNADGKPDLLWRNKATGQNLIWLLNGTSYISTTVLPTEPDQGWKVAGVCDFYGDGGREIFFQHSVTGQIVYWKLSGGAYVSGVSYMTIDPAWQIAGTGNFGGANGADLLWRNKTTGEVLIWTMNKGVYQTTKHLYTTSLDWQIEGMR